MLLVYDLFIGVFVLFTVLIHPVSAQNDTLGLSDGFSTFNTSTFSIQLVKDSQTLYSLTTLNGSFNFIPTDMMSDRARNGNYHLGDITFRARTVGSNSWVNGDSSTSRKKVTAEQIAGTTLAAANLSPTLPSGSLLNITRRWVVSQDGVLQLLFDVTNSQKEAVEIGALGAPLEFNNIFTGRTATDTNNLCSLFDPYIGQDAGYVQVTPLLGTLPPLLVLPATNTTSPLEGWRFLPESTSLTPFYQSQTFEGLYEWQFHTLAYAQNEWANVTPWNAPTSAILQVNETRTYGLEFRVVDEIRRIEDGVVGAGKPLGVTIPGTIVSMDQVGKLFLNYARSVGNITVEPNGALVLTPNSDAQTEPWVGYDVVPRIWGRSRVEILYEDGTLQTVNYLVTKAATEVVGDLGGFLTTESWFDDDEDPFGRAPSVISYDREVNAPVLNDPRAWIPGLEDEAGAGSWLAASMKQFVQPNQEEVAKMERFVNETLWGRIQNANGTVKKSIFFYEPSLVPNYTYPASIDWTNWWSWTQPESYATDRSYDYVHVIAAYWALYRVARNYPELLTQPEHGWEWYLSQAVLTVSTLTGAGFADDGLMGETVIRYLLDDLRREGEGWSGNATLVESRMRERWEVWKGERFPFGSEMAWDSTGQEGVYVWSTYFNDSTTAVNALNSILAYQPVIAHWGYNGNARRYWDNIYGGKLMRIERQIHHYGSGLNALPLIFAFESSPEDYYLLRAGFGGLCGPLSNIDQGGFASASFHSFADTLAWDAYSGDYGPNFSGHAMGMGTFIVDHKDFGWQVFGGNVLSESEGTVEVEVRDSVRRRVFVAPIGALLVLDAGAFDFVRVTGTGTGTGKNVTVDLGVVRGVGAGAGAEEGRLVVSQTATQSGGGGGVGMLRPVGGLSVDGGGAWVVEFGEGEGGVGNVTLVAGA